ncbi:MAG: hypothetical protein Q9213_000774 [Squamulea squamosa]
MHSLSHISSALAIIGAASSLVVAEPFQLSPQPIAKADAVLFKRQDPAATCTDALCVLSHAQETMPSTTKQDNGPTTTATDQSSTAKPRNANIRVSVAQPSLCSESALQFSSSYAVPTGQIIIQTETGWGEQGSVWNITANDGVELANFKVPCQGSACTGITGNKEEDGSIVKNPDGSWSMNVTAKMQPSVHLVGDASGGNPTDGNYDLTVTSTPPCALPIFQNCSARDFDPTADQWEAYSTGPFLTKYLADNNINSLSDLHAKASNDFLPTIDAQGRICNPDAGEFLVCLPITYGQELICDLKLGQTYDCDYPASGQCESDKPDAVAGFLVVAAVVRMSQMLSLIYSTIDQAKSDMSAYITQIVVKFFQPQAEQEWQAIVTAVSSIIGLFTFVAIIIDTFTAGATSGVVVAAVVGIQSALAAASNFNKGFTKQKPDSTYLAIDGNYSQSVVDYSRGLQELVNNIWANTELTQSGIATALASGAWLDVGNPYNVTGIATQARDWLDNLLVTSYINRVFNDADAFIVFLPYKKYVYSGVYGRTELYDFTQTDCETHWANDPSWKYFATCDIPLGGDPGMAVVTRPSSEGDGSKPWTSKIEWVWASYTWNSHDFVSSAVTGFGEHGFGYNLTNIKFDDLLKQGSQEAIDQWKRLPLSTPGLFNIPVCILTDMMDLPGGGQVATDVSQWSLAFHYFNS